MCYEAMLRCAKEKAGRETMTYDDLVNQGASDLDTQIAMDCHRTFSGNTEANAEWRAALRQLLNAYARRNSAVGYCQGMNFVAGFLLLELSEPDAFWTLCFVVEDLLPADYYANSLLGVRVEQQVSNHLVEKHLPQTWAHLESMELSLEIISLPWLISVFVGELPQSELRHVWGCVLDHGPVHMQQALLAVLASCEAQLLDMQSSMQVLELLRGGRRASGMLEGSEHCSAFGFDADSFHQHLELFAAEVLKEDVASLRDKFRGTLLLGDAVAEVQYSLETVRTSVSQLNLALKTVADNASEDTQRDGAALWTESMSQLQSAVRALQKDTGALKTILDDPEPIMVAAVEEMGIPLQQLQFTCKDIQSFPGILPNELGAGTPDLAIAKVKRLAELVEEAQALLAQGTRRGSSAASKARMRALLEEKLRGTGGFMLALAEAAPLTQMQPNETAVLQLSKDVGNLGMDMTRDVITGTSEGVQNLWAGTCKGMGAFATGTKDLAVQASNAMFSVARTATPPLFRESEANPPEESTEALESSQSKTMPPS